MELWLKKDDPLAVQFFGITLWRLWQGRNQLIFKNSPFDLASIAQSAVLLVEEFNLANRKADCQPISRVPTRWCPPQTGTVKINVDAGVFTDGSTGWGFVARDHHGAVLFSATRKEEMVVTPLVAETLALRWCLSWAEGEQFTSLCIETDAEQVVHCLRRRKKIAAIEFLILDCLDYLSRFSNCSVNFASRNCNQVAHSLVGLAKTVGNRCWVGSVPQQIYPSLCKDFPHYQ
jgi:ribonuclease HI